MDYLMGYAWVILIVMLVCIGLWMLGVFDIEHEPVNDINYTEVCKDILPNATEAKYLGESKAGCALYSCDRVEYVTILHNNETMNITHCTVLGMICI